MQTSRKRTNVPKVEPKPSIVPGTLVRTLKLRGVTIVWSSPVVPTSALKFYLHSDDVVLVIASMTIHELPHPPEDHVLIMHEHGYGWVNVQNLEAVT